MTSQDTGGVGLSDGRAAASACWRGLTRSLWWRLASSGRTARGWGASGGGSGALWVGGAFVQYAQPLASRSRPSWSRPARADSRRDSKRGRRPTMTTGTLRRRRVGGGSGDGPVMGAPGCAARTSDSLLRGLVSTALTSTDPASMFPAEIVEILRLFSGVRRRCARDVSTMDTDTPPDLFPSARRRLLGHQPAPGSRPSECLRSHNPHMSQK